MATYHPQVETTLASAIDLRRLAELQGPERAFVSYYFSGTDSLGTLRQREANVRQLLAESPAELEHFERSIELIHAWLETASPKGSGCVLACWALDFCEGYQLTLPLPDYLYAGDAPYIRPLALLQDEYESFALVVADNTDTRIYLVTSGDAERIARVKGDIKNHVKKGGWSQKRYQKRRANQLMHYAKDVGAALAALAETETFDRIVFVGSMEAINEIERELPAAVADKSMRKKGIDLHEGDDHTLAEAFELFIEQERAAEKALWGRIREEFLSGGLAAVGATNVLKSALTGRVEAIAVTQGAVIRGVKCRDCENIVHGTPQTCQICGSRSVFRLDLIDELARLAELTSASIDFVEPIDGLSQAGDVAALLRY